MEETTKRKLEGTKEQQRLREAKKEADKQKPASQGMQPHEIAERANMKRQQKKMHEQG